MRVTRLKLSNVRAIEAAEFRFGPGFNLVVGVNGVGKTTVLETLARCLQECVASIDGGIVPSAFFKADDVRVGAEALDVECDVDHGGASYNCVTHRGRQDGGSGALQHVRRSGGSIERNEGKPFAIFFSTMRAVPYGRSPGKKATAGGMAAALAGAFSDRHLGLAEFAAWMRTRRVLAGERAARGRVLQVLDETVRRLLPGYGNLRPGEEDRALLIDRGGVTIPVRRLSDGERGVLALVLDLARRLSQANPEEQLEYANLLGACPGGEGGRPKDQHCDTRKADRDLLWNPADPDHRVEARIRYGADGSVRADDEEFDAQLDSVLNLNLPLLKNHRKSVLDAVLVWWSSPAEGMGRSRLEREVRRRTGGDGPLEPYVGVAVWWLERRSARMGS